MYIFPLGNPGKKYENTPHNAGQIIIKNIETFLPAGISVIYPDTFMNESGVFVKKFLDYKNYPKEDYSNIVIVYDDIDLPIGEIKLSYGRGDGGHNGLKSIIQNLGTNEFIRIRIGICPTDNEGNVRKPKNIFGQNRTHKYVLRPLSSSEVVRLLNGSNKLKGIVESLRLNGYQKTTSLLGAL